MKKIWSFLVGWGLSLFLICVGCARDDQKLTPQGDSEANQEGAVNRVEFTLKVQMEGLVALVRKPVTNPDSMWALLLNTTSDSNLPANCRQPQRTVRHFAAIRINSKFLDPEQNQSGSDIMTIIPLHGEDISLELSNICPEPGFSVKNDHLLPKMRDFAPTLSTPCTGCATDNVNSVDHDRISGRFLFKKVPVEIDKPIKHNGNDVKWCLEKLHEAGCKDYKPMGQQVKAEIQKCSLNEGEAMLLTLVKKATAVRKLKLYPEGGEIAIEMVNFLPADVFEPSHQAQQPSKQIPHFNWFYEASSAAQQHSGKCPVPETTDIASFAGKPYCPLIELDPVN